MPGLLRRLLGALAGRWDLAVVALVLAALAIAVFWLHLVPLPAPGVVRQVECPSGPHASGRPAPGCRRFSQAARGGAAGGPA